MTLQLHQGGYGWEFPSVASWRQTVADLDSSEKQSDSIFDQVYPEPIRSLSSAHWTPLRVINSAVKLLVVNSRTRVLDVGSGSGKFCIAGALMSEGQFTGVEQRYELACLSSKLVSLYAIPRVSIHYEKMESFDWSRFNAFYLYNPFLEVLLGHLSDSISIQRKQFQYYIGVVQQKLQCAPIGSRVVTYHGFGGAMPLGYVRTHRESMGSGDLELWIHRGRLGNS